MNCCYQLHSSISTFFTITVTRCNLLYQCIRRNLLHPSVACTVLLFLTSVARTVFSFSSCRHTTFSSLPGAGAASGHTTIISNCIDDGPVDEAPVPATSLDARTSRCSSSSSMSRRPFPVAFVTSVGVLSESSFRPHSSVMSSTCLFDSHSDSCGLLLFLLHEWCPSIISPPNTVGPMCGMIFVLKCAVRTRLTTPGAAALPLENNSVPRRIVTYPWFSQAKVLGSSTAGTPVKMFLISFPQHVFVSRFPHHAFTRLQPTPCEWC